jgi:hypothetical protein
MLLLLIGLIAAAQASPRDAVALTSDDQMRGICAALSNQGGEPAPGVTQTRSRAQELARTYQLRVPANGFGLGRYRADEQELELDGDRALRALDGALTLDLTGIDDVAFRATPEQMKQWAAAKRDGKLSLTVFFHPSGHRCAGNAAARIFRMEGSPLWWEIEGESGPLAAADEDGLPVDRGRGRSVVVQKVSVDTDLPRPDPGKERLASAQAALDRCGQAARRRGTMVVSFSVQGGKVRDPQVVMDAARDEPTAKCVAQALSGAAIAGADAAAVRGTASLSLQ